MKLDRRTFSSQRGCRHGAASAGCHGAAAATPAVKRRMVCINTPLGVHPANFFPELSPSGRGGA